MDPRARALIAELALRPHPEGGYFGEVFRSSSRVRPLDGRPERASLTTIYFLLTEADISRWHRVVSDEAWHFYEGADLELLTANETFVGIELHRLGRPRAGTQAVHVVPAGRWQAARSTGAYTLVGCTVAPGFEFDDFEMLAEGSDVMRAARASAHAARFI